MVIKNGTVIDGSGAPARRADVAVAAGKIAEIGKIADGAKRGVDAADCVVAPGFIDPHTHYDAQICWDPAFACWGDILRSHRARLFLRLARQRLV
jgi:N-acyl-D-aspartate/D-glutamate deacylase